MRYVQSQPVTLLVPTDDAFAHLKLRVKSQLFGKKLRQLLEHHMIINRLPAGFLNIARTDARFTTVYGQDIVKHESTVPGQIVLSTAGVKDTSKLARIVLRDIEGKGKLLMSVHGVSQVLLPSHVFRWT